MKTIRKKTTAWLIAILALSFAYNAKCDDQTGAQKTTSDQTSAYQNNNTPEGMPARYNKASGLIGMDVENEKGEHLGHITDIVFDLKNDRVSYVVMTTSPKVTLGIDEKLLAVPLSAFTTSSNDKRLILNADKSKVEAAVGFNKNNWPDVGNPSWGAQPFWQQNGNENRNNKPQSYLNPNYQNYPNQPGTVIESPGAGYRAGVQDYPPPS